MSVAYRNGKVHRKRSSGAGQSSSSSPQCPAPDSDEQMARVLQKMLDDEASMEEINNLRLDEEASPYSSGLKTDWSELGKGKGKGRDERFSRAESVGGSHDDGIRVLGQPAEDAATQTNITNSSGILKRSVSFVRERPRSAGTKGQHPQEIQESLELLHQFYVSFSRIKCRKCSSSVGAHLDIKDIIHKWREAKVKHGDSQIVSICAVQCTKPTCGADTCLGCGEAPRTGLNTREVEGTLLDWCCDNGRLFAIWLLLARYDRVELQEQAKHVERVAKAERKGKGSQGDHKKGIGYAAYTEADHKELLRAMQYQRRDAGGLTFGEAGTPVMNFKSTNERTDDSLRTILNFLSELLPSLLAPNPSGFDDFPPKTLNAMLRLGLLLDKLAGLLRNDSIDDLTKRSSLYFAIFRFVERLGTHWATVGLVGNERYSKLRSKGLHTLSKGAQNRESSSATPFMCDRALDIGDPNEALTPALVSRFSNLVKQSQIILYQSKEGQEAFNGRSGQMTLDMCEQIVTTYTKINSNLGDDTRAATSAGDRWVKFHEKQALEQTDKVLESFHFQHELHELERTRFPPRGRMQHIVKEIATMTTSLPDGIFVKSCSSTPGAFKCLMLGPQDTPYFGGLFE